ncbi:MAG: FixH family protein [Nitrospirae bacterium]|nr:FixH family protein [Nitrospirota bacterium]
MKLLLVLVTIIGLSAVIGAIVVGTRTFDGTIVDKPYERGLAYDAVHHEKEASGWHVEIMNKELTVGTNDILLSVTDRNGKPLADAGISLSISRPSSKAFDKTYSAVKTEKGQFIAKADLPLYGYWAAVIKVTDGGKSIAFEKTLYAEKKGS